MRQDFEERHVIIGQYIAEKNCTVREAAARFGISKSTVHKDVTDKLKITNYALYLEVKKVLETNKAERHIRGGEATRQKYIQEKRPLTL